jgi:non-specific serine/threonine protein kinase
VGGDPLEGLVAYLQMRTMLLVLDNFEHVIEAASEVAALLDHAAGVMALVTSRELLRVRGELEFRVPPLSADGEAVRLFAERASTTSGGLDLDPEDVPVVAAICRRLDYVPLAIELAAPRLRLLTPGQLLERLSERLTLAGPRDAPVRQQTLESAIAWSYGLLEPLERHVFERLGVFRGSFSLEGAEAVCDAPPGADLVDVLGSLLDKSLMYRLPGGRGRFAMLSMIREFSFERLARSGKVDQTLEQLTAHYLDLATRWDDAMRTVGSDWIVEVDEEADTARAVIARLVEQDRGRELATMIRGLWGWLWFRGQLDEGREWTGATLVHRDRIPPGDRAWMLLVDGCFAYFQVDFAGAAAQLEQAQELFEATGDPLGAALALTVASMVTAATEGKERALSGLSKALAVLEREDDAWGVAVALSGSSRIRSVFGDFEGAEEHLNRTLAAAESLGDPFLIILALDNHARYRISTGDAKGTREVVERALALVRTTGIRYAVDDLLEVYAWLETDAGEYARAAELLGTAEVLREAMRVPLWGPLIDRHAALEREVREALGEAAFNAGRERGRGLPLDHWCEETAPSTA